MVEEDPKASVFMPVRNEEKYIEESLDSLMNQDYPDEKYEVVVVDGMSEDRTREIVENYMERHDNIRLVENPELNVSEGRRIGVEESRGKYVIAFSGHSYADQDFIRKLVERLEGADEEIAGVGCRHETPEEDSDTAKAIGLAMGSVFGGAGTTFRHPEEEQVMDSIAFTCYRKDVVEEVGGPSNPELERTGNDAEFNLRIKEAGYKLLYIPDTKAYHHKKGDLSGFFKWSMNYGIARAKIIDMHGWEGSKVYVLPTLLVLGLVGSGVLSLFFWVFEWLFLLGVGGYLVSALISSASVSKRYGFSFVPKVFAAYLEEHFGYGLGFLAGLLGSDFV